MEYPDNNCLNASPPHSLAWAIVIPCTSAADGGITNPSWYTNLLTSRTALPVPSQITQAASTSRGGSSPNPHSPVVSTSKTSTLSSPFTSRTCRKNLEPKGEINFLFCFKPTILFSPQATHNLTRSLTRPEQTIMINTIHIAFTESAGGCLKAAFRDQPDQHVADLADDLSLGPINPYHYPDRQVYFETLYTGTEYASWYQEVLPRIRTFWEETRPGTTRRIVWFTRRSAIEYSGFLEFLSREPDPCAIEVIDLTEGVDVLWEDEPNELPDRVIPISLSELAPKWLKDQTNRTQFLSRSEAAFYLRSWERLKDDEDGVRTLWRGQLYPTVPSTLGEDVLYAVPEDWTSAATVIGEAFSTSSDEYNQCGDAFLYSRLLFLIRCGEVEARGDPVSMQTLQVRRADVVDEDDLFPAIP